ncbi:probable tRNA methyltransferase 9B [Pelobates cultripes]|uniref:Probable tRNA methyltransferase 9B n=1 Tax=Pelobates cultripes TaxID=61616 RepID=A0AAD1R705_PELCU|nr:probable tRNA methyltransferase 9B [Pelobates cultripes]
MEKEASRLERAHVHSVYEQIAPYFNDKRYKAWPKVQEFLLEQEPGSLIADIGCGNGKYLHINNKSFKVGCDYCFPLAESARNHGYEVMVCDGLNLPYRAGCFDAALSIAVIHHFSTKERRIQAIKEISRILKFGGKVMIYVWAKEQKKRRFEKQDILVPWKLEPSAPDISSEDLEQSMKPYLRTNPINNQSNSKDTSIKIHSSEKRCSFISERETNGKTFGNLSKSSILSRSLDSGLDVDSKRDDNIQKYQGLLGRFYDYCIQITMSKSGSPFELSKPGSFLKQIGDFFPRHIQNFDGTVFRQTESPVQPLQNMSSNIDHPTRVDVIKAYSKVPLPDLVDSHHSKPPKCTANYAEPYKTGSKKQYENADLECEVFSGNPHKPESSNNKCFRYYHIFKKGELKELIENYVPELHVVTDFFDHSNWCVVAEKVQILKL